MICKKEVMHALDDEKWPISMCSSRMEAGCTSLLTDLENTVARFVQKEAAIVFATVIPAITGPESLIVSDSLNHTSLVNGARNSDCAIRVFRHNSASHLEEVLREVIVQGQPKHHRP